MICIVSIIKIHRQGGLVFYRLETKCSDLHDLVQEGNQTPLLKVQTLLVYMSLKLELRCLTDLR